MAVNYTRAYEVTEPSKAVLSVGFNYEALACPFCGEETTHIDYITVGWPEDYDDTGESPRFCRTIDAKNGKVSHIDRTELRYSRRRQWVEIHIDCEQCPGGAVVFGQNKGATEVFKVPAAGYLTGRPSANRRGESESADWIDTTELTVQLYAAERQVRELKAQIETLTADHQSE